MTFRRTRCPHCKGKLEPMQRIHAECIEPFADAEEAKSKRKAAKKARMQARVERAEYRQRKEKAMTIADLIAAAQQAFNEYIRLRDLGKPCICCGKPMEPQRPGGSVDAGHYLSRGASSHLRFSEDNCFSQRKSCNRPGGTTRAAFREGVLARIGPERLAAVESDYHVHKWDREELIAIRATYRAKLKALKAMS